MNSVRVKKNELEMKVWENKQRHDKLLKETTRRYWAACKAELEKAMERVEKMDKSWSVGLLSLPKPEDHSMDYEDAMAMLKMSCDETIELSAEDFSKLVLNQWEWRRGFLHVCSSYGMNGPTGPTGSSGDEGVSGQIDF